MMGVPFLSGHFLCGYFYLNYGLKGSENILIQS